MSAPTTLEQLDQYAIFIDPVEERKIRERLGLKNYTQVIKEAEYRGFELGGHRNHHRHRAFKYFKLHFIAEDGAKKAIPRQLVQGVLDDVIEGVIARVESDAAQAERAAVLAEAAAVEAAASRTKIEEARVLAEAAAFEAEASRTKTEEARVQAEANAAIVKSAAVNIEPRPAQAEGYVLGIKLSTETFNKSIFEKVKCREHLNKNKLLGFLSNEMGDVFEKTDDGFKYKSESEMYRKFYDTCYNKQTGTFQTTYRLAKYKWGRVLPKDWLSLSIFKRNTRHSFAKGEYRDIDMKNAHPVIQYNILKTAGYDEYPTLKRYAFNYSKCRAEIMEFYGCDKDTAKKLIFRIAYGGTYEAWLKKYKYTARMDWVNELEREYEIIGAIVYAENKHIIKDVLKAYPGKYTDRRAAIRGCLGLWSQSVERLCQETAIKWLVDNKGFELEDIIPSQDGFMILQQLYYEGLIEDINKVNLEAWGIPIEFAEKDFDEAFEIPDYVNGRSFDDWMDSMSPKRLSVKFLDYFGGNIKRFQSSIYVFFEGRWYDESDKESRTRLTRLLSENLYDVVSREIKEDVSLSENCVEILMRTLRTMTCKSSTMKDVVIHILTNAIELKEDFNKNPFLYGFTNGVFDLMKSEFRPYTQTDYLTETCGWDYDETDFAEEVALLQEIIRTIQPDEEIRDWMMRILCSGLDGVGYQNIFLFEGKGRNGKGLLGKFMKAVLGGYYYQPSNSILQDITKSGAASPEMFKTKGKRYLNFTEMEGQLSTAIIKKLTGGDTIEARRLHSNGGEFTLSATVALEFNMAPDFDGKPNSDALYHRVFHTEFCNSFVTDREQIGKTINGVTYCEANPLFALPDFATKHRQAFFNVLVKYYNRFKVQGMGIPFSLSEAPAKIRIKTTTFLDDQNVYHKVFGQQFVIVEDQNEVFKVKDAWELVQTSDEYRRLQARDRRLYTREGFISYLKGRVTVDENPKRGSYIKGVKLRFCDKDEPEELDELNTVGKASRW